MLTAPANPDGATQVIILPSALTLGEVHAQPPMATVAVEAKSVPTRVRLVPPAIGPEEGVTETSLGAGPSELVVGVGVGVGVGEAVTTTAGSTDVRPFEDGGEPHEPIQRANKNKSPTQLLPERTAR